jgi:hypothetical protein
MQLARKDNIHLQVLLLTNCLVRSNLKGGFNTIQTYYKRDTEFPINYRHFTVNDSERAMKYVRWLTEFSRL